MPDVSLSLDLSSLFVETGDLAADPVSVRDAMRKAVVEAAAQKLVSGFDHDELYKMRQQVQQTRSVLIQGRLRDEVDKAFDQPIQRMTEWGEKRGEVTSVRELIRMELEAFLSGTHTHRKRDTYDKTPNNLAELIGSIANETMRGALAGSIRDAKAKVDKEVQKILTDAIAAKLSGQVR